MTAASAEMRTGLAVTAASAEMRAGLVVTGAAAGTHLCPLGHVLTNPVANGPARTPEPRAVATRPGRRGLRGLASAGTTMRADACGRLGRRARRLGGGPAGVATVIAPPATATFATTFATTFTATAVRPVVVPPARRTSALLAGASRFRPSAQYLLDQFVRAAHDRFTLLAALGRAHLLHRPFADLADLGPLFLGEISAHHAHATGGVSPTAASHESARPASATAAVPVLRHRPAACQYQHCGCHQYHRHVSSHLSAPQEKPFCCASRAPRPAFTAIVAHFFLTSG